MGKIKVSEKHGLNPSISVCFFCGKDKGVVALGKLKDDEKAPKRAIFDYEPCEECKEKQRHGVTIIEVVTTDNKTVPIQKGAWPTGRWCMISRDVADKLFNNKHNKVLLEDTLYNALINSKA